MKSVSSMLEDTKKWKIVYRENGITTCIYKSWGLTKLTLTYYEFNQSLTLKCHLFFWIVDITHEIDSLFLMGCFDRMLDNYYHDKDFGA